MRRKPRSFLLLSIALSASVFFSYVIDSSSPTFASAMPKSNQLDPTITYTWGPSYEPRPGVAQAFGSNMNPGPGVLFTIPPCDNGLPGLYEGMCGVDRRFLNLENSLSPCLVNSETTCIDNVEVLLDSGSWISATLDSEALDRPLTWPAFPNLDIGPANNGNIYSFQEASTGIQRLLFVRAAYELSYSNLNIGPSQYEILINTVDKTNWENCRNTSLDSINWFVSGSSPLTKPPTSSSICYLRTPFENRIRLSLKMKNPPNGWVETYLSSADAKLSTNFSDSLPHKMIIEGSPVKLPKAKLVIPHSDIESRQILCNSGLPKGLNWCSETNKLWSSIGYSTTSTNGLDPFGSFTEAVKLFPKQLDIAETEYSTWRVRIKRADYRTVGNCSLPTGIYGLIGGNALLLSSSIPIWNPTSQSLEFGVTSPHYRPDGQTATGFYEMQINEKVAQCLWGTTITPQNVSLSVFDDNGQTKAAAATISSANGMIAFRASGFTYSSSTLRANLKTTKNVSAAKRLTCIKGRSSKLQPRGVTKCPKGWKKK